MSDLVKTFWVIRATKRHHFRSYMKFNGFYLLVWYYGGRAQNLRIFDTEHEARERCEAATEKPVELHMTIGRLA